MTLQTFKGCLPQILLGPVLNTLTHIEVLGYIWWKRYMSIPTWIHSQNSEAAETQSVRIPSHGTSQENQPNQHWNTWKLCNELEHSPSSLKESQFPLTFFQSQTRCFFSSYSSDYFRTHWDGLCDHLRDVPWECIFKLGASATPLFRILWVNPIIDAYISYWWY